MTKIRVPFKQKVVTCPKCGHVGTLPPERDEAAAELTCLRAEVDRLRTAIMPKDCPEFAADVDPVVMLREERRVWNEGIADLERKLGVAVDDLEKCMEGLEHLKQIASFGPAIHANLGEAGMNEVTLRAEYAERVQHSTRLWADAHNDTEAAGLGKGA